MLRKVTNLSNTLRLFYCFLSAVILVYAFPKNQYWFLAWVGLLPLLYAIDGQKKFKAFWLGYFCGVIFFTGTLYWFVYVTIVGAALLVLYFALYFGLFALGCAYFHDQKPLAKAVLIPSLWVALEWIRAHFLSGFDWVSLGQSQYKILPIIQIADITGMVGVSFLIVLVNVAFKHIRSKEVVFVAVVCVLSALLYGQARLKDARQFNESSAMSVAVIQANIAQHLKWKRSAWPEIMDRYESITKEAAKKSPNMIIWPETSFPGFLWEDKDFFERLQKLAREIKIPILFGSIMHEEDDAYYNSAVLLGPRGELLQRYDKIHLVPFGEYVPFRSQFPNLASFVPIADFAAGREYDTFSVRADNESALAWRGFSVLICFEDTVARLTRRFVREGAQLLVNMTNDAWFEDTKAPYLHLQSAVFRTVENRRWLIRAANTGISCFIDAHGRIIGGVMNKERKPTYVAGYAVANVTLNQTQSLYTKLGDVFTYLCFGCILLGILRKKYSHINIRSLFK